jgi:glycosyltransferase involved in cell wall biosynthesis
MKITIGIPAYKQDEFLSEAVESALAQTYQDIEIIVVDDGSPDNTGKIADGYIPLSNGKLKVVHQVNKGLASARNTAIMNMTGDYFLPLDSDDILMENCIEKIVEVIEKTGADIVAPSIRCFGLGHNDTILMPNPTFDDFKAGNRLAYCSAIKKDALLECGGYSPKMDTLGGYEDLHLWYDMMNRGKKIVTIQEPLVMYRTKTESMWTKAEENKGALWAQIIKDFPKTKDHAKS